jgi:uncharacterized protein
MINRQILPVLIEKLNENPAVALLGPRRVGKTTLALKAAEHHDALYLDLESHIDRGRLDELEAFLESQQDRLVILDEIHRMPGIFPVLRGLIDRGRRKGKRSRRFLILGSASLELLKQSGETLAGRISYLELRPLNVLETSVDCNANSKKNFGFVVGILKAILPAQSIRVHAGGRTSQRRRVKQVRHYGCQNDAALS